MSKELEQAQNQIRALQEEVDRLERELDAIRLSTSWRMTAVFRHPLSRLVHFKRTARLMAYRVAARGGWTRMVGDAFGAVAKHGLEPVRNLLVFTKTNGHIRPSIGSDGHDRRDYMHWRKQGHVNYDRVKTAADLSAGPVISVVIPTYKPPLDLFQKALESIMGQDYTRWEICVADDASGDQALADYMANLCQQDPRVRFTVRPINGHISACSNSALELATGDFVLLLDQDDIVPANALRLVADALARHPDCRILFTDEDRMSADATEHFGPYFKPDFNYDLFLGQNMVSHLGVYHRETLRQIGGFRVGMEGSQDYDLALRVLETCTTNQVIRLPYVLYNWRAIKGSTALANSEKSYASTAGLRAVRDHLERIGVKAEVESGAELKFFNQIRYALPEPQPAVSIVLAISESDEILSGLIGQMAQKAGAVTPRFLVLSSTANAASIRQASGQAVEVLPMPADAHAAMVASLAFQPNARFLCFVNAPFMDLSDGWLEELVRFAAQERVGLVAPRIRNGLMQLDHGGVLMLESDRAVYAHQGLEKGDPGNAGRAALTQRYSTVSAALAVVRVRDNLANLVDPVLPWSHSIVDLGLTLSDQGADNLWTPVVDARFEHPAYAGRLNLFNDRSLSGSARKHWVAKWHGKVRERNYNPNLSPEGDFSLNWKRAESLS